MRQVVRYKSAADYATVEIQRLILSGEIPPGAKIDQIELAERLDVSRHPVRQAIERLAERGFIHLHPHRSAVVPEISVEDMDDLYLARSVIEEWALRRAWPNYTSEWVARLRELESSLGRIDPTAELDAYMEANRSFHLAMHEPCGNRHTLRSIITLFDLSERYQRTALHHDMRQEESKREHAEMVEAIEAGNLDKLLALVNQHNNGTRATITRHVKAMPKAAPPA